MKQTIHLELLQLVQQTDHFPSS
ncbi:hypothetical protein CGLO_14631 [Colletotrichum gloeosporioides Cg-14]|uniref:Uncharacterized protein n=1 Tax=Colletotrichum gloeosporioides (strain Cg-14) TaxID=1237896 RepID=T0LDB6_COLGC|nr:hypothetical protein CGLO_14631 [Colletotrichum gloeosporioides Cg-14]